MRRGLPPLCRCVLPLAQGGRLCGLARLLARKPERWSPNSIQASTAGTALWGEWEWQAESAEEHDSVLRVRHPCVGARWEGREGAARCIASL